ncbi:MAG: non-ribosomal peptide synthetase, partial [Nitrospirales bacterium]
NLYGSTECTSNVTAYNTQSITSESMRVPIGRPLPNIQVFVLDRHLRAVPIGAVGELCVSGICLARGYVNLPQLTANHFIPNAHSKLPGVRLFKTGDLARYLSNGVLEVVGRQDNQVKLRGFRLDLADIESILGQHSQVKHCAVSVFKEDLEHKQLIAYLVPDVPLSTAKIRQFLQERLPDYMVPTSIVLLETLPLTPNGKIDRKALPAPKCADQIRETAYVAPRTVLEELLVEMWQKALKVERIGTHDNFFDMGGHSLLAMQVTSTVENRFSIPFPLMQAFETPTIAEWATYIARVSIQNQNTTTQPVTPFAQDREEGVL